MGQRVHLARPPIKEAVIQFVFDDVAFGRGILSSIASQYVAEGWKQQKAEKIDAVIDASSLDVEGQSAEIVMSSERSFMGYVMISADDNDRVQLRPSVVAVSKTEYTEWDDLVSLARRAFQSYAILAGPAARVKQISTRFINRISPIRGVDSFDEILKRPPKSTDGLEEAHVADFMRRHVIQGIRGGFKANLTVGTVVWEPSDIEPGRPLVIDIDAYIDCDLPANFDQFTENLGRLREIKNELFFGSLTEQVLARFR